MAEERITLNKENQTLPDQVNSLYPEGSVFAQFHGDKSEYVRRDQATQQTIPGALVIIMTGLTAPNYTASHKLLHLLMLLKGFPQISLQLSLGDKELDEQMVIMSTDLCNIAMHRVVVAKQRKHGLITDEIEEQYLKGIEHTLTPEEERGDGRVLRLLTLLGILIFYGDHISKYEKTLVKKYPLALATAKKMYAEITKKPIKSPFDMRRSIVKIYSSFDQQIQEWGLPVLHNNKYTTLSPVLSARQLRLEMHQVFEIYHSDMKKRGTDKRAYVGLRRSDGQNSLTPPAPAQNTPEEFKKVYSQPMEEFLEQNSIPYIVRK